MFKLTPSLCSILFISNPAKRRNSKFQLKLYALTFLCAVGGKGHVTFLFV